jgi:hypothetical protein
LSITLLKERHPLFKLIEDEQRSLLNRPLTDALEEAIYREDRAALGIVHVRKKRWQDWRCVAIAVTNRLQNHLLSGSRLYANPFRLEPFFHGLAQQPCIDEGGFANS